MNDSRASSMSDASTVMTEPPGSSVSLLRRYHRTRLPGPRPDPFAYRLNRWLALATSPRRLVNYLRYRRAGRSSRVSYLPIKLDIENVSRCNFHCAMCQVSDWPKLQRAPDMSLEEFKRLLDAQYGLLEIKLQGMGEPLLQGEAYFEMIRYARAKRIWVRTTTNASLLHLNDNYKKLIDAGVNEVQISIDGACKETFEAIRRGSRFERVAENCQLINGYCDAHGLVRTKMWVVLQRDNLGEFFEFIPLARALGFRRLCFALNLTDWGQARWHETNSAAAVEDTVSSEMAREAIARGRRLGLEVGFWNITLKYSHEPQRRLCPWPFERAYVSSDLRIVPCCKIANPEVSDFGDARALSAQWLGEAYQAFRQAHLEGRIPTVCQDCYESRYQTAA